MADFTPIAGTHDFQMIGQVNPPGAAIDGNMVGACYDELGEEIPLPTGYSFLEESPLVTRLVCPTVADANDAPDVIVAQKADKDLASGPPVYIAGQKFRVKTIAPEAASINTVAAGVVPKL